MSSIAQDFFCGEEDNKNFSTLVADAECQEAASLHASVRAQAMSPTVMRELLAPRKACVVLNWCSLEHVPFMKPK